MELTFQSQPYHFLRNIMQEVRFQEETAEIIVPDSYPDIGTISDCCAEAILRGKDCRDGGVSVAGGVKGVILYTPEDQSYPRNLEVYIPFSIKLENPSLTAHSQVLCNLRVCTLDARMINSRKAMLRVNLGCEITAYEDGSDIRYRLENTVPGLQIKEAAYSTKIPLETAEKSFSVNDMIELPAGRPAVSRIYEFQCWPEVTDEKLVGNKAVFKGILRCKMLYLAEDEMLYSYEQSIPFSQYCELHADYDEELIETQLMITGYDLEATTDHDGQIPINVNILAQCVVHGTQVMNLIEDAYSTNGVLTPIWEEYDLEGNLDQQSALQTIRQRISGSLREVLDTSVYWSYPAVTRSADKAAVKVSAFIRVLGYDENGTLQALTAKTETAYDMMLSENADCHAKAAPAGDVLSLPEVGGVEARCSLRLSVGCYSKEKLRTLCGGNIEEAESDTRRPSLIIRMVEKDTPLWDLAKAYGTTKEDIMAANQMESTALIEDTMLLLPIS